MSAPPQHAGPPPPSAARPSAPERRAWLSPAAVAAGVLLAVWAWWLERPPAPLGADAPPERFAAARALEHLRQIAVRPHMTGSAEHTRVREYLVAGLRELGFETEVHETTVLDRRGRMVRAATVRNVVARKRGTDSTGGVAVAAHYDSQQLAPGAGDDGAGVAAILEAVRALGAGAPLGNDLYVLITDAEELGLLGARGLVNEHLWWPEIDLLLSFEARGAAGPSVMFETNAGNGWVVREFARADPRPTGSSLYYEVYQRLPNDTDFSVYKRAGVTGLNFAIAEDAHVYHLAADSIENLSLASVQHHGEHALALLRHFGNLDLARPTTAPDVTFFRFAGLGLVSYPYAWVGVLSLLALAFAGTVVERGFRRGRLSVAGMATGLALSMLALPLAFGGAWLMWNIVSGVHHELDAMPGRALYDESWYGLATACLAVAVVAALFGAARHRCSAPSLVAGALVLPLAMTLVSWWYAPGINMLFLWPAVFGVGGLRYLSSRPPKELPGGGELAVLAVLSAPVVLIMFPLVWTLYIGLSISAAPLIGAGVVLLLLLLLPLFELATRPGRVWLPAAALGLAIGFIAVGVIGARASVVRPLPTDLVYALDRERATAVWATMQQEDDGWIERFVPAGAVTGDLAPFLSGNPRPYRLAPAPHVAAPAATVRVAAGSVEAGARLVRLEIVSAIAPELLSVSTDAARPAALLAVNGEPVAPRIDATGGPGWLLQHFGQPPAGTLTLELLMTADGGPLELVLVEFLMRLPPVPGVDTERPPGWVAHGGRLTDASVFRQVIRID